MQVKVHEYYSKPCQGMWLTGLEKSKIFTWRVRERKCQPKTTTCYKSEKSCNIHNKTVYYST